MENPPLTQKEIDRLAELMIPISEAQLLDSKDNKEFSELITKLRTQLEKQKEEQKKQTIKRYDITDKQEK